MKIPPIYTISPENIALIAKIEANFIFFEYLTISSKIIDAIQKYHFLKASIYSARTKGNTLTLENYHNSSDYEKKKEILCILKAIKYINLNINNQSNITTEFIVILNKIVLGEKKPNAGIFRYKDKVIYDNSGKVINVTPHPFFILQYLDKLCTYINSGYEKLPLVVALISLLVFEKIHPFVNGNGRVGKLLVHAILQKKWKNRFFIPYEENLELNKKNYYKTLQNGIERIDDYLSFMLNTYYLQSEKLKKRLIVAVNEIDKSLLPPRQEALYKIISNIKNISFDQVKKNFSEIPERTLRYDLKKLQEKKLLIKIGKTKGCIYRISKN